MQILWIDGAPQAFTPRGELRLALRAGRTMNEAERDRSRSLMTPAAFDRFERLWAISTATEHPLTRRMSLERWSARRERVRAAVRGYIGRAGA